MLSDCNLGNPTLDLFSTSHSVWQATCFYKSWRAPGISVLIYNLMKDRLSSSGGGIWSRSFPLNEGASLQRAQTYRHTEVKSLFVCLRVDPGGIYSLTVGLWGRLLPTGDPGPSGLDHWL